MKALILILVTILSLWTDLSNGKPSEEINILQRSPSQLVMDSVPPAGMF